MKISVSVTVSTSPSARTPSQSSQAARSEMGDVTQSMPFRQPDLPATSRVIKNSPLVELEDSPQPDSTVGRSGELAARNSSTTQRQPSPTNCQASSQQSDSTDLSDGGVLLTVDDFDDQTQTARFTFSSSPPEEVVEDSKPGDGGDSDAGEIVVLHRQVYESQTTPRSHEANQNLTQLTAPEEGLDHPAESGPTPTTSDGTHSKQVRTAEPQEVADIARAQQSTVPSKLAPVEDIQGAEGKGSTQTSTPSSRWAQAQEEPQPEPLTISSACMSSGIHSFSLADDVRNDCKCRTRLINAG